MLDAPASPSAVQLTNPSIVNPELQSLVIKLTLILPDGTRSQLGAISPFPADQPSVYTLPLDDRQREALARGGMAELRLELLPADTNQSLSPALNLRFQATFRA